MSIQNAMIEVKARMAAFSVGVLLEQVPGGFYLFSAKDGEQLGYDFDEAWPAEDVIDYCTKLAEGMKAGVF